MTSGLASLYHNTESAPWLMNTVRCHSCNRVPGKNLNILRSDKKTHEYILPKLNATPIQLSLSWILKMPAAIPVLGEVKSRMERDSNLNLKYLTFGNSTKTYGQVNTYLPKSCKKCAQVRDPRA